MKASILYGFNIIHLDKIIGMAFAENLASRQVMEKAGLQYEKQIQIWNLEAIYYSIAAEN